MAATPRTRGNVVGAAILTAAGAFWCIIALCYWSARPGWAIPLASAATQAASRVYVVGSAAIGTLLADHFYRP